MNTNQLKKQEAALKQLQSELQAEMDQPPEEASTVMLDGSMGRVSRGDALQVQQMALEMQRRRAERLQRIESALIRIQKGTYGTCCRCRKNISPDRLEAFPDAVLCVGCAR